MLLRGFTVFHLEIWDFIGILRRPQLRRSRDHFSEFDALQKKKTWKFGGFHEKIVTFLRHFSVCKEFHWEDFQGIDIRVNHSSSFRIKLLRKMLFSSFFQNLLFINIATHMGNGFLFDISLTISYHPQLKPWAAFRS